ncbi:hypothetical protein NAPIS_ORF02743 [Vairimorpha apis BRL 01]|uniref:Uncharacterized protein n=1 Tax=Vairimorpha apis BRL 01 TaxID=1037528 RepID=T0MF45_9MICR|nr:hypothetical protein NAPIS_ORF02743 [Vairimorpha apis BRL 01]
MDLSIILEFKKINIIKNTRRTIDKLILLRSQNKLSNYKEKLVKLKELINKNIDEIEHLNFLIKNRNTYDVSMFYIIEFLNINQCFYTSEMLSKKYKITSDIQFYKEIYSLLDKLHTDDFLDILKFMKDYKSLFKPSNIQQIKNDYFLSLCHSSKFKNCLSFIRNNNIDKKLLIYLNENLMKTREMILNAFGISSFRLQKRIEYGIMSFKTKHCSKEVPYNHIEHSLILCKGSGDLINHENSGYAFKNGNVYGEKYLQDNNILDEGTNPRKLYFM